MKAKLIEPIKKYQVQGLQWWRKREPREQYLLLTMSVLMLILVFWYGIWQPVQDATSRAENRLASQQETLRYVIENTARVEQLRQRQPQREQGQAVSAAQLSSFISNTSEEYNLEVSRLQPQSESLQVVYNEAAFDDLLAFLGALGARQVQVDAIDIAESGEPGMVRVRRLQVRAGGS